MPSKKDQSDPKIIRNLRDYRQSLIERENMQTKRLAREWLRIENSLLDEMHLLALQINDAKEQGLAITEQLVRRMSRYDKLNNQMKNQILKFAKDDAVPDIEGEQREYGLMAIDISVDIIKSQFVKFAPAFDRLPAQHVETFVGLLGNGDPLYSLLKEAYPDALDGVIKSLLLGTAKGLNPSQVAMEMAKGMGIGLERITLIARTEQLRVNRLVSAEQYRTSGLEGVMKRVATKDDRVCMACLVSDGEIIPLDKELDDHPRGRCTAIFQIKGIKEIQWEKGSDWFVKQSESMQREMMGDEKWEAWQAGKFDLSDLRGNSHSNIWGDSPRVPSLNELLGGDTGSTFDIPTPDKPLDGGETEIREGERFRSNEIADEKLASVIDVWEKDLSQEEKDAIEFYTNDGYVDMNALLRYGDSKDQSVIDAIENTKNALKDAPPIPIDLQVTRGFRYQELYDALKSGKVSVGDTLEDQGFMSTSVMNNIRDQPNQINYDIFIPAGTKNVAYLDGLSGIPEEAEVLFSPDIKLQVKEIKIMEKGGITVILEVAE